MRGRKVFFGPVGVLGIALGIGSMLVGAWAIVLMLLTRNTLLGIAAGVCFLLAVGLGVLAMRSMILVTAKGIRIPGSPPIPLHEITAVVLEPAHDGLGRRTAQQPLIERARGRGVMTTPLDGLTGKPGSARLRRQARQLAILANCELRIDDAPPTKPGGGNKPAPRRGI